MNTTKSMKIQMPTSKNEEIELFENLVKFFEKSDTYLKDLFCNDMAGWVEYRVKADFPLDIYSIMTEEEQDAEMTAHRLDEANAEIVSLKEKLEYLTRASADISNENDKLRDENDKLRDENDKLRDENERLHLQIRRMELERELEEVNKKLINK